MAAVAPMLALFGSLGTPELIVIGAALLLLFGGRLPEVMRNLGRGVIEFKKGLRDTQEEIERSADESDTAARKASDKAAKGSEQTH